jgi:hypothetical protein
MVHPGIQFKPVECNALFPNGYLNQIRSDFAVEAVPVHTNVKRGVPQPNESRYEGRGSARPLRGGIRHARYLPAMASRP